MSIIDGIPCDETTSDYASYVRTRVDDKRWEHSVATARLAAELAARNGELPERAFLAGLVHDVARPMSDEDLLGRVNSEDEVSEIEFRYPTLLHGMVAVKLIRKDMACTDDELLFAVRHHTCGHPSFGTLGKCLMVADYAEPNRDFPEARAIRSQLTLDLDIVLLGVVESKLEYARNSGWDIEPLMVALRDVLRQNVDGRQVR